MVLDMMQHDLAEQSPIVAAQIAFTAARFPNSKPRTPNGRLVSRRPDQAGG
jgi:hypothetical protein